MKALIFHSLSQPGNPVDIMRIRRIIRALKRGGFPAEYTPVCDTAQLIHAVKNLKPDIVFSTSYYVADSGNREINIHSILEEAGIPYIGSLPSSLELVLSKYMLKSIWQTRGIRTPEGYLATRENQPFYPDQRNAYRQGFPYLLKPNREGNSRGLDETCVVYDHQALVQKLEDLLERYDEILIERYLGQIPGMREFTVAMIGNGKSRLILPVEILLKGYKPVRLVTTEDKDQHRTSAISIQDADLREKIRLFAGRAFDAAGMRDYARCDVIVAGGGLFAIEINGQPIVPDRWFEACAQEAGLDEDGYIQAIFAAGISRYPALRMPPGFHSITPGLVVSERDLE